MEKIGNDHLAKRDYPKAIMNYNIASQSILDNTKLHIIFSNRSQAFLMSNDACSAYKDAELCISLQPDFSTGYLRKGACV